jgi:hypothetical protein
MKLCDEKERRETKREEMTTVTTMKDTRTHTTTTPQASLLLGVFKAGLISA